MKTGKKLLGVLVGVVVVLVICVVCAFFFIDSIAKAGIEKGGTYALGVPTRVGSADVGVFSGTFDMSNFEVDNPTGFASPHFLTLGKGDVAVSLGSLMKDTVELPKLALDTIDVRLEKKDGKSNYSVILDNLKKVSGGGGDSGGGGGKPAPKPQPAPQGTGNEKKYIVQDLSVRNVMVHIDLSGAGGVVGALTKVTVPIEEIKMQNVGKTGSGVGGSGVTMGQLSGIIVKAVLAAAVQKGGDIIPGDMLGELQGGLAGLGGLGGSVAEMGLSVVGNAKGSVEQIGGEAKKVEEDVKKTADEAKKKIEDVGKGIKDLLPKKKN